MRDRASAPPRGQFIFAQRVHRVERTDSHGAGIRPLTQVAAIAPLLASVLRQLRT